MSKMQLLENEYKKQYEEQGKIFPELFAKLEKISLAVYSKKLNLPELQNIIKN